MFEELTPVDIGLPPHFSSWRSIQEQASELAIYADRRFTVLSMPTGSGKSLTVMTIAKILGMRTVILTATKGLMDQYTSDFGNPATKVLRKLGTPLSSKRPPDELIDIRGRNNYSCSDITHVQCDDGPKLGCKYASTHNCSYSSALKTARSSQIVVTNYKYWLHVNQGSSNGLTRLPGEGPANPPQLLVLDEAHLAPEELSSFLAIRISEREIHELLHTASIQSELIKDWKQFAKEWKATAKLEVEERTKILQQKQSKGGGVSRADINAVRSYEILHDKLDRLSAMSNSGWVCERKDGTRVGRVWEFDPVWPGQYAERALFCGIPKVVLVSATVRPKTCGLLGIPHNEFQFKEWRRVFPANRCPVYHLPTARIRQSSTEQDYRAWIERIDQIIESRLGRKGIIHTVSYDRQDYIFRHSKYSKYMLGNINDPDSPSAAQIVARFKQSAAPSILVSPSFSTGWDFPGKECEWQIISKVPFPVTHSKVMRERKERDPLYPNYLAMQELVQACGRGMRSETDRCETFIVDDSIGWFMMQSRYLCPDWFMVRKMQRDVIPAPPPAL